MSRSENRREELQEIRRILTEIGEKVDGIQERVERVLEGEETDAAAEDHPSRRMWRALQGISEGTSQEEILSFYLSATREYLERAVLFLHRGSQYVPWKSYELDLETVEPIDEGGSDPLSLAAGGREIVVVRTGLMESFGWLKASGSIPEVAICVPFLFEGKVPVILYGDSSKRVRPADLELLTQVTLLLLKHHSVKTRLAERSSSPQDRREEAVTRPASQETGSEGLETIQGQHRGGEGQAPNPPVSSAPAAAGGAPGARMREAEGETGEQTDCSLSGEGIPSEIRAIHHGPSIAEDLPSPAGSGAFGARFPEPEEESDRSP